MTSNVSSGYSQIPFQDNPLEQSEALKMDVDEGNGLECPLCESQARENRLLRKDRSLTIHILCLFIILLSANLVLHGIFYNHTLGSDLLEEHSSASWSTISCESHSLVHIPGTLN